MFEIETMNFEELRDIAREQKSKSRLTKLDSDFYESVRAYLDMLRREQETASGRELQFLSDEIKAATDRLQHIFNHRVRKILDLASLNLTGELGDTRQHTDMMTPIEREIYHSVLDAMRNGWSVVEGMIAGEPVPQAAAAMTATKIATEVTPEVVPNVTPEVATGTSAGQPAARDADAAGNIAEETEAATGTTTRTKDDSGALSDYTVVYVLKDIPTFVGADGNHYTLLRNDVVTLPNLNSRVLCKRRAVSPIAVT